MVGSVRSSGVNPFAATRTFDEHPQVTATLRELGKRAREGGASSIMFLPSRATKYEAYAFAYHTGLAKELNVLSPVTDNKLRGHVVINISGHASGNVGDRVTAFAESAFAKHGIRIGDDAKRFVALREASQRASDELQRDPTKQSATIAFEGKTVELARGSWERMRSARVDSDDEELARVAWDGNQALQKFFASTNTYNIQIRTADGNTEIVRGIPRNDPSKIEYATKIALEIPLGAGETVLEAWPEGSAKVNGYVEARRYKIHNGTNLFDVDRAVDAAEQYKAAHPEIRWDTEHEDDDLEEHRVHPSPYPYQDF